MSLEWCIIRADGDGRCVSAGRIIYGFTWNRLITEARTFGGYINNISSRIFYEITWCVINVVRIRIFPLWKGSNCRSSLRRWVRMVVGCSESRWNEIQWSKIAIDYIEFLNKVYKCMIS